MIGDSFERELPLRIHRHFVPLVPLAFALSCGRVGFDELADRSSLALEDGGVRAAPPDASGPEPGSGGTTGTGGKIATGGRNAGGTSTGGVTSSGGNRTGGATSSGGAAPGTGGVPTTCEASQCPTASCNIAKPFPCCNKDNTCGCSWAAAFYCN